QTSSRPRHSLSRSTKHIVSIHHKDTSSRPKQWTVLSSVAQWRDPCISPLSLFVFKSVDIGHPCRSALSLANPLNLLVSQRFNRIQVRGLPCRINPKD